MELWVSVEKGEYDGGLGSDTQQSGEECPLGKGLRAVIEKSRWSDSNRRPLAYKARALPLSYIGTRTVYHRWSRCAEGWMAARNKGSRLESLDRFLFKSVSLSSCNVRFASQPHGSWHTTHRTLQSLLAAFLAILRF